MRHALHTEIEIDAGPEAVWHVLTDLDSYDEWNPFITSASGEATVGTRLVNRLSPPGGKAMTFKPVVTAADAPHAFEWLGRLGMPGLFDGRHRFDLSPSVSGGTTLVHTEQFSGLLVRLFRRSLDTQTVAGFEAMNTALKARSEAGARSSSAERCLS